jgi:hypothetical protein
MVCLECFWMKLGPIKVFASSLFDVNVFPSGAVLTAKFGATVVDRGLRPQSRECGELD